MTDHALSLDRLCAKKKCGLNFKQGGFAIRGFSFRADPFTSKDSEHAGLKEVDSLRFSLFQSKRNVP